MGLIRVVVQQLDVVAFTHVATALLRQRRRIHLCGGGGRAPYSMLILPTTSTPSCTLASIVHMFLLLHVVGGGVAFVCASCHPDSN